MRVPANHLGQMPPSLAPELQVEGQDTTASASTDVQLGHQDRYLEATPFKRASVTTIRLETEIPRSQRFHTEEDEQKLLQAAPPHLHAVIVAMLETACRPGEILSLQWADVNLRTPLTVDAAC